MEEEEEDEDEEEEEDEDVEGEITKFDISDDVELLFIILESSEKKSIEFCKGCVFNLEGNININCV
jgi:hypothetical protein